MAFFKFRKPADDSAVSSRQPESIDAMRRRARHRLVGAAVLVLAGVIGFPQLFDTQPRPIAVDIPIEIPDRNKVKPLAPPRTEPQAATGDVTLAPSAVAGPVSLPAPLPLPPSPAAGKPETKVATAPAVVESKAEPRAPAKPEPKPESPPEPKAVAKVEPKPEVKPASSDGGARARALLEGKPPADFAASEGRFVVQVGAFADPNKARETRLRVERAGLKTYTHVAETKDGKRTRVRVGPFASRAEADQAAAKIKGLDLPAAILTL
jgi:DedD protein